VDTLEKKGKTKRNKHIRNKAQEVLERVKVLQGEEGESDMNKRLDEKWTMEMWAEVGRAFGAERRGEELCVLPRKHEPIRFHGYPTLFICSPGCL